MHDHGQGGMLPVKKAVWLGIRGLDRPTTATCNNPFGFIVNTLPTHSLPVHKSLLRHAEVYLHSPPATATPTELCSFRLFFTSARARMHASTTTATHRAPHTTVRIARIQQQQPHRLALLPEATATHTHAYTPPPTRIDAPTPQDPALKETPYIPTSPWLMNTQSSIRQSDHGHRAGLSASLGACMRAVVVDIRRKRRRDRHGRRREREPHAGEGHAHGHSRYTNGQRNGRASAHGPTLSLGLAAAARGGPVGLGGAVSGRWSSTFAKQANRSHDHPHD